MSDNVKDTVDGEDEYLKMVLNTVNRYKSAVDILGEGQHEIYPEDVNRLLATYQVTILGLIAEYQRANRNFYRIKRQFNFWWNTVLGETRQKMRKETDKSKYLTMKEFELQAQLEYSLTYEDWQDKLGEAEAKRDFVRMVLDSWKSFENIIANLSYNMRAEMKSLGVERRTTPSAGAVRVPISVHK